MVDQNDNDNLVDEQVAGWQLAALLLGGFRTLVDEMHDVLAHRGHPEARPLHGFTLQAIGSGATAAEVAARLGVSKQAAAKTLARLEEEGYVSRSTDPADARRKTVVPTRRGRDLLRKSERAFDEVAQRWRRTAGDAAIDDLARTLTAAGVSRSLRLDLGSWSG